MHILMMTNTYAPHVGGVARSITRFARQFRHLGHRVKIVAPEFDGTAEDEPDVVRLPARRHFNHTDFSLALPVPHRLERLFDSFQPDVIHSHHPFLIGGTALRVAHTHRLPIVFTHHTRYEDYTHNVPGDSPALKRFVVRLATNYANLCDQVFVPSESIARLVQARGVSTPVSVVPTGVELAAFEHGDGRAMRHRLGIPADAFVVGHLGRLTHEKNIPFLVDALLHFVSNADLALDAHCLVFGSGPLEADIKTRFETAGLGTRLHVGGVVDEASLTDAYQAMDAFAFASTTETQGMVLTEAMANGLPVVAVDAPGVREVVEDRRDGRLLGRLDVVEFSAALSWIASRDEGEREALAMAARDKAAQFAMERTADRALAHYVRLYHADSTTRPEQFAAWVDALRLAESEWELLTNTLRSAAEALQHR